MNYTMTPEEELELAFNIAKIKRTISLYSQGIKHSAIVTVLLIVLGFMTLNMGFEVLPYVLFITAIITAYICYKCAYNWDFKSHVLMSIEKPDFEFFINNDWTK